MSELDLKPGKMYHWTSDVESRVRADFLVSCSRSRIHVPLYNHDQPSALHSMSFSRVSLVGICCRSCRRAWRHLFLGRW